MSDTFFTAANVVVEPYQFERITSLKLLKQVNEHVSFSITGIVPDGLLDQYVEKADEEESIQVFLRDDERQVILFQGTVSDITVRAVNHVREMTVEAASLTLLMDLTRQSRSFQHTGQAYNELFSQLTAGYADAEVIDEASGGRSIGELLVQYNETDWAFVKRAASRLHAVVIPFSMQQGLKFVVGLPDLGEARPLEEFNYTIRKDLHEYKLKAGNGIPEASEQSSLSYEVTSPKVLELGSPVSFQGQTLYVARAETGIEGGLVVSRYHLRNKQGFECRTVYATQLAGVSLFGKITKISKDKVQLHLEIDHGSSSSGAMWFPYSTVYSSPDGSGWYVMPEEGDEVRLYFPDEQEHHAFAASSVDIASSDPVKRSDPSVKSISTKYGKQIVFKPGAVEIIGSGQLLMRLTDEGGIEINSDKKIKLHAEGDIEIQGSKVFIEGQEGVDLIQAGATLQIMKDVTLSGGKVNIE
ncbi:contractile injection system protein, VgrG/Pvc8 family [Paenibacillus durus]|uniref:Mu-like prophage tail protein GpP n=1 Tax=Paenibacillus durus TaxID=44251 RepID=A0A089IZ44_PAEDU|nr:contractile injection system protein, VgrG/Pvc8 family [Paenibacillus durus]AIQ14229.1 Mu-like prophage tail protein GpP [Paenibacillus durus]